MNKIALVILLAFVSLVIGYNSYPILNKVQLGENASNSVGLLVPPSKQPPTIQNNVQQKQAENKSKAKTKAINEKINSDKGSKNILDQQQKPSTTPPPQNNDYSEEAYVNNSEQLAELQVWFENHKKNLKNLVNSNLPTERAKDLMEQILDDNPFLNENVIKQDPYIDQEWSYKMTSTINNLILQDPHGFEIEVLSLTCKQLTCEIFVRELVKGSWFDVYRTLMTYFLSNQYLIETRDMKQFMFLNGDEYLYYQHLIFAK